MNKEFLLYIIQKIDTKTSRTEGTSGNKNFQVTQEMIDTFGRVSIMDTLLELERNLPKDSIKISWIKHGMQKIDVSKFSIRKETIDELYQIAGMESPRAKLRRAEKAIKEQMAKCKTEWLVKDYYTKRLDQIRRGTIPVNWEDARLDHAINMVAENREPIFERIFSVRNFQDIKARGITPSKAFELLYRKKVCNILKKTCPELSGCEEFSDHDVLRFFNILSYNLEAEFKGPAIYTYEDTEFSSIGFAPGITLNTNAILSVSFKQLPGVKQIVTIENKATYEAAEYNPETLYIYTGGFLSPRERKLYGQLNTICPDAVFYHWGDLDYGGIRIYKHLKEKLFPTLQPLHMDIASYDEYEKHATGYEITEEVYKKLERIDAGELQPLKRKLLETGVAYEQELFSQS